MPTDIRTVDERYVELLRDIGVQAGLARVGVAAPAPFTTTKQILETRKAQGLHGGMQFTYRNPDRSTDPRQALPRVAAIVVAAKAYTGRQPAAPGDGRLYGRVARYSAKDHYAELRDGLDAIAAALEHDGWATRVVLDDNALVDREAAHRAGLGWYGKNSNILLPGQGSWFVLGSVLTDAPLPTNEVVEGDGCGSCRRCIDGCPTGAIVAPGVVDARRCLAWLVQAEGDFPEEFREALGDRIYGCDDCQEVCPPNRASVRADTGTTTQAQAQSETDADVDGTWVSLLDLLAASDDELLARHGRWYIPRRDPNVVRRNALVALGNTAPHDHAGTIATIRHYLAHPDGMLRRHAAWAAERLAIESADLEPPTEVAER